MVRSPFHFLALALSTLLHAVTATAQVPLPRVDELTIESNNAAKFQRLDSAGVFKGCELQFRQSFSEKVDGGGSRTGIGAGSLLSYWEPGRAFNFIVVVRPSWTAAGSDGKSTLDPFKPAYAGLAWAASRWKSIARVGLNA